MRRIIILWHIILFPFLGYSQICGLNDTIPLPSGLTTNIPIEINPGDLVNENLADPLQGLCGIELDFIHAFVEELDLTLISPSNQSVQLTGPTTTTVAGNNTFAARWRIRFIPSTDIAQPDAGFTAQWNNNQITNFISGGQYSGNYYPFNGNLEDFNTGNTFGT